MVFRDTSVARFLSLLVISVRPPPTKSFRLPRARQSHVRVTNDHETRDHVVSDVHEAQPQATLPDRVPPHGTIHQSRARSVPERPVFSTVMPPAMTTAPVPSHLSFETGPYADELTYLTLSSTSAARLAPCHPLNDFPCGCIVPGRHLIPGDRLNIIAVAKTNTIQ